MHERIERIVTTARHAVLALCCAAAACSTQSVTLKGQVGEKLNPNLVGDPAVVDVYAFFLKKGEADAERTRFLAPDKRLGDFLVDSVRNERRPPPFLADDTVAIEVVQLTPAQADRWPVVEQRVVVPSEAAQVGLIAAWQSHRDNATDEVWRLLVPIRGGAVQFRADGVRLEEVTEVPPKPKEAPRGNTNNR